jgi:predicted O-linked N-acetylglucosamine transferase (SPINDLY family)
MTEALSDFSDHFKTINTKNDQELALLIEKDEIDILVTLAGRFDENRPLVATYRPAPIQVSFHDCATSGLEAMDYYLTDSIIHPPSSKEKFTEHLYRLPTYYQYPTHNGLPVVNDSPVIKNGYITFCSFNKPEKIGEEVVELWAKVLKAIPNSRLLLKYFGHYSEPLMLERTIKRFKKHKIGKERLILNAAIDKQVDHLALYHQADIALDPFPFNGATTTFEALSMGVPVITLQGNHFVSRVATSLVTHIGYPELAAKSSENYIEIAKDLTNNVKKLNSIRKSLRKQLINSPLCDGITYAKDVEIAFRDMWSTWCKTGGYKGN